jgi:hypothetical protein
VLFIAVEENYFRSLPENLIASSCSITMQQAMNVWSNLSTYGKVASVAALAVPVLFRIRKVSSESLEKSGSELF